MSTYRPIMTIDCNISQFIIMMHVDRFVPRPMEIALWLDFLFLAKIVVINKYCLQIDNMYIMIHRQFGMCGIVILFQKIICNYLFRFNVSVMLFIHVFILNMSVKEMFSYLNIEYVCKEMFTYEKTSEFKDFGSVNI